MWRKVSLDIKLSDDCCVQSDQLTFRRQVNVNVDQVYPVVIAPYAVIGMPLLMVFVLRAIKAALVI